MLQNLVRNLVRGSTKKPLRASSFRPQLEGLEDRLVLSTAQLTPAGLLNINVTAGSTPTQPDVVTLQAITSAPGQTPTQMKVSEDSIGSTENQLGIFSINQIKSVAITAAGNTQIYFSYKNGPMFNKGVPVTLQGGLNDTNNWFVLNDGKFNETETLTLSGSAKVKSTLSLGGNTFNFDSTYTNVLDMAGNSGNFFVHTPAKQILVDKGSFVPLAYQITSPGVPNVTFWDKAFVHLEMDGPSGSILRLNTSTCAGLQTLSVDMNAANDKVELNGQHFGLNTVIYAHEANDVIDVAPVTQSLSSIGGNVDVVNTSGNPATLNVHNENNGSYPFAISVTSLPVTPGPVGFHFITPVKVNLFQSTGTTSFTVDGSDANVLDGAPASSSAALTGSATS